jgi:hypothetical protein
MYFTVIFERSDTICNKLHKINSSLILRNNLLCITKEQFQSYMKLESSYLWLCLL